jgi:hypothetical protein
LIEIEITEITEYIEYIEEIITEIVYIVHYKKVTKKVTKKPVRTNKPLKVCQKPVRRVRAINQRIRNLRTRIQKNRTLRNNAKKPAQKENIQKRITTLRQNIQKLRVSRAAITKNRKNCFKKPASKPRPQTKRPVKKDCSKPVKRVRALNQKIRNLQTRIQANRKRRQGATKPEQKKAIQNVINRLRKLIQQRRVARNAVRKAHKGCFKPGKPRPTPVRPKIVRRPRTPTKPKKNCAKPRQRVKAINMRIVRRRE